MSISGQLAGDLHNPCKLIIFLLKKLPLNNKNPKSVNPNKHVILVSFIAMRLFI